MLARMFKTILQTFSDEGLQRKDIIVLIEMVYGRTENTYGFWDNCQHSEAYDLDEGDWNSKYRIEKSKFNAGHGYQCPTCNEEILD